jgi:hypothetical protein
MKNLISLAFFAMTRDLRLNDVCKKGIRRGALGTRR